MSFVRDLVNEVLNIYILNFIYIKFVLVEYFVYVFYKCMCIKIVNWKLGYFIM